MADNVVYQNQAPATPAPNVTVASDDVGGVQYQRVKLDLGADGASSPVVAYLPVNVLGENYEVTELGTWGGKVAFPRVILGRRSLGWSSTSVFGDVAAYLDTSQPRLNAVVAATTYYIVSTSADDTNTTGIGARKVRVIYLDAAGDQQVKTVNMNGTGAVSLGSGHSYFQWIEVSEVGTNTTSVGQINIGTVNGAQTVASTVEAILAGGNRSMSGRYKVPTGTTAYIVAWEAFAIAQTMDVRLRSTVFGDDRTLSTVFHFEDSAWLAAGANSGHDLHYHLACPAGAEIKLSAIPGGAPAVNRCDAQFTVLTVNN